jgi:hypothetical protein
LLKISFKRNIPYVCVHKKIVLFSYTACRMLLSNCHKMKNFFLSYLHITKKAEMMKKIVFMNRIHKMRRLTFYASQKLDFMKIFFLFLTYRRKKKARWCSSFVCWKQRKWQKKFFFCCSIECEKIATRPFFESVFTMNWWDRHRRMVESISSIH